MTRRIMDKHYAKMSVPHFADLIETACDDVLFTYDGKDYMVIVDDDFRTGEVQWGLCDAEEVCRKQMKYKMAKWISETYPTLDDALHAPLLNGKSIIQRFEEIQVCDDFTYREID